MGGILKAWHQESQCRAFFYIPKATKARMLANESNISPAPYPLLEKGNRDSPPFVKGGGEGF